MTPIDIFCIIRSTEISRSHAMSPSCIHTGFPPCIFPHPSPLLVTVRAVGRTAGGSSADGRLRAQRPHRGGSLDCHVCQHLGTKASEPARGDVSQVRKYGTWEMPKEKCSKLLSSLLNTSVVSVCIGYMRIGSIAFFLYMFSFLWQPYYREMV